MKTAEEFFKEEYGHSYNLPLDSIEAIKFATRYASQRPTLSHGEVMKAFNDVIAESFERVILSKGDDGFQDWLKDKATSICQLAPKQVGDEEIQRLFIKFFQEATRINNLIGTQAFHIIGFYKTFAKENNIQSLTPKAPEPKEQSFYNKVHDDIKAIKKRIAENPDTMQSFKDYISNETLTPEPKEPSGWISVEDRLPEDSCACYVINAFDETDAGKIAHLFDDGWEENRLGDNITQIVTHWMPLPPAPEQEEEMGTYDGKRYIVGTRLTSKENGEIIEASPDTPEDMIVCIVKADKE